MPSFRLAKSLETLRQQIDQLAPNRDKDNDGWIGDTSHQTRKSEHNPDSNGVVRALDISTTPHMALIARPLPSNCDNPKTHAFFI